MKIGVDAGCLGVKDERLKVGVYNVCLQLFIHLSIIDSKNTYYLYSFYPISKTTLRKIGKNFKNIVIYPKLGWANSWLPLKARRDKVDIFIGISQFIPSLLPDSIMKMGFIYDLAFYEHPSLFRDSKKKLTKITQSVISESDDIVTISEHSKKDILNHFQVKKVKIHVLHPGHKKIEVINNEGKSHFLYLGALKKGKNVPGIIRAYDNFQKKNPSDIKLVIAGGDLWYDEEIDTALSEVADTTLKKIVMRGYVSDKELGKLYSEAIAFVSPSFYEGFGLTHAEAMAAGIPIIASDRGSLPEVVGNAGILVDPYSPEKIAEAMTRIVKDKKLRNTLSKNGIEKGKHYSWEKFARGVYEIIQSYEKT